MVFEIGRWTGFGTVFGASSGAPEVEECIRRSGDRRSFWGGN